MQGKVNYQLELDKIINKLDENQVPTLLLHSCCAPCSSYVLEYLSQYFSITVLYYNPNIYPPEEFYKRLNEQEKLIEKMPVKHKISFIGTEHLPERFYKAVKGMESLPEGGERCRVCFNLRLDEAGRLAKEMGFDYFTTTLTISPMKDASILNEVGQEVAKRYDVNFLPSDFKKKNGYKRSTELSREYGIYRQNYCGCIFSIREQAKNN